MEQVEQQRLTIQREDEEEGRDIPDELLGAYILVISLSSPFHDHTIRSSEAHGNAGRSYSPFRPRNRPLDHSVAPLLVRRGSLYTRTSPNGGSQSQNPAHAHCQIPNIIIMND
jgi:hypothetical protein